MPAFDADVLAFFRKHLGRPLMMRRISTSGR
jgi:hypothetical protein